MGEGYNGSHDVGEDKDRDKTTTSGIQYTPLVSFRREYETPSTDGLRSDILIRVLDSIPSSGSDCLPRYLLLSSIPQPIHIR